MLAKFDFFTAEKILNDTILCKVFVALRHFLRQNFHYYIQPARVLMVIASTL